MFNEFRKQHYLLVAKQSNANLINFFFCNIKSNHHFYDIENMLFNELYISCKIKNRYLKVIKTKTLDC